MPLRPAPTFGHPIDDALRRAILDSLEAQTYSTQRVWRTYLSKFGCSQVSELVRRLRDRYGEQAGELVFPGADTQSERSGLAGCDRHAAQCSDGSV